MTEAGSRSGAAALACLAVVGLLGACGSDRRVTSTSSVPRSLLLEERPIGVGARFHPPASGPPIGPCRRRLGQRFGVHIEVFAANRVVLLPAGMGTRPPRAWSAGRVVQARCYGGLVTLDPTGLVLVRSGARLSLADVFRSWGEPLSRSRLGSFQAPAGHPVVAFVDGRRWRGAPQSVSLARHAEIVVEVGPPVPPHSSYAFPPGT